MKFKTYVDNYARAVGDRAYFIRVESDQRSAFSSEIEVRQIESLINAAPDLLDALKGLLPLFSSPSGYGKTREELIKDAMDAIAKAEK